MMANSARLAEYASRGHENAVKAVQNNAPSFDPSFVLPRPKGRPKSKAKAASHSNFASGDVHNATNMYTKFGRKSGPPECAPEINSVSLKGSQHKKRKKTSTS